MARAIFQNRSSWTIPVWKSTRPGSTGCAPGQVAQHSDMVTAEVEKGFGNLTLEIEVPYERDWNAGAVSRGMGNINLGARHPFYQHVSAGGFFDTTFGGAIEAGIPASSAISVEPEFVPKMFPTTPRLATISPRNPSSAGPAGRRRRGTGVCRRLSPVSLSAMRLSITNCRCPACSNSSRCSTWSGTRR